MGFETDDTQIMPASAVCDESQIDGIIANTYNLSEFLSPGHYLSYEELSIRLDKVLNGPNSKYISGVSQTRTEVKETLIPEETNVKSESKRVVKESKKEKEIDVEDDELAAFFAELDS